MSVINKQLALSLFNIAFKTRFYLPLLISAGFMLLDYQLTIEVEVEANVRNNNEDDQPQRNF